MASCDSEVQEVSEMTLADFVLYTETHLRSLAAQLECQPHLKQVRFRILHYRNLLSRSGAAHDPRYGVLATTIDVEIPQISWPSENYWFQIAERTVIELSRRLQTENCYTYH